MSQKKDDTLAMNLDNYFGMEGVCSKGMQVQIHNRMYKMVQNLNLEQICEILGHLVYWSYLDAIP
jgi:hypothetical protein